MVVMGGCGAESPAPPTIVPVKVMTVLQQDTTVYNEYIGEVQGSQYVELRARVNGVLVGKHFEDGTLVQEGDLLFTIDPRDGLAQLATAKARLASARATVARARQDVARYKPLLRQNAIARQVYDYAVAAAEAGEAEVDANQALVDQVTLTVAYANVTAPFTGRIGAAKVFEGDLITAGSSLLAELSNVDPAWVYFSVSEAKLLAFDERHGLQEPSADDPIRQVILTMSDGAAYDKTGRINFTDRALDSVTGTYRLRAEFPNAEHQLRPGMFARIRLQSDQRMNALLVPDRAVVQLLGRYFVIVIGTDGNAEQRPITPGPRQGALWIIDEGLAAGEKVVVEGVQKARPGIPLELIEVTLEQLSGSSVPINPSGN